jgi:N6-adenosine-specific RNA methylase IME4
MTIDELPDADINTDSWVCRFCGGDWIGDRCKNCYEDRQTCAIPPEFTGDIHPAADLFPMQNDQTFNALVQSIASEGLLDKIWLTKDGDLLDGRNRHRACVQANVEPQFRCYFGDDPIGFVLALNSDTRRHLTESQRAMIAGRAANMTHGHFRVSGKFATHSETAITLEDAAATLHVSKRSATDARSVITQGSTNLVEAVDTGKVAVSTAAILARGLDQDEQRELIAADDEKAVIAKANEIRTRRRQERLAERAVRDAALANKPIDITSLDTFAVLYVDPPWRYDHMVSTVREIENHYPTMSHDEMVAMQIPAAENAVMFMWVTNPKLEEGLALLTAWGFEYRTNMVWVKDKIGMGYYARSRHELLLIAKRGNMSPPDDDRRPDSVITATRGRHSKKPDQVYELIDAMYPHTPKVELFARNQRDGWASWGNQA